MPLMPTRSSRAKFAAFFLRHTESKDLHFGASAHTRNLRGATLAPAPLKTHCNPDRKSTISDHECLAAAAATAVRQTVRCVSSSLRARSISTEAYAMRFELTRRNTSVQVVMYSPWRLSKAHSR